VFGAGLESKLQKIIMQRIAQTEVIESLESIACNSYDESYGAEGGSVERVDTFDEVEYASGMGLNAHDPSLANLSSNQNETINEAFSDNDDSHFLNYASGIEFQQPFFDSDVKYRMNLTYLMSYCKLGCRVQISTVATGALLSILRPFHPFLPLDPRTLKKTPIAVRCTDSESRKWGEYFHIGLEYGIS